MSAFRDIRTSEDIATSRLAPSRPIAAYLTLIASPLFQAVGKAAETNIAINRHYTDLGLALQFSQWIPEAAAAAINSLNSSYGFEPEDRDWISAWVETHNLGIQLPWS